MSASLAAIATRGAVILFVCSIFVIRSKLKLPPRPVGFPILGCLLRFRKGLTPVILSHVAEEYGDVCLLRMGKDNVVVVSSPEMAKEVLQTQGEVFGSRVRNMVFNLTSGGGSDMVFADYGDHWRKMRRIATEGFFTKRIVQQSQGLWEAEMDLAVKDILATEGATTTGVALRKRLQRAMYNMLYIITFARRFDSDKDPVYEEIHRLNILNGVLGAGFQHTVGDSFPPARLFLRRHMKKIRDANRDRHVMFKDVFISDHEKVATSLGRRTGVDYILDAHQNGDISEKHVMYLLQNLNVGGLQTTVQLAKWAVAQLVNHPQVQRKIHKELEDILGKGVAFTGPAIAKLPYLQAVTKEVFRKCMTIPMLVPHKNSKPAKLGGYDIPVNSRVLVNALGIANNPKYWDKPEKFDPERFMKEDIDLFGGDFRLLPFGVGRRSCPGGYMGYYWTALVIGKLVQGFEMLPPPGQQTVDTTPFYGQLVYVMEKSLIVVVRPRGCNTESTKSEAKVL